MAERAEKPFPSMGKGWDGVEAPASADGRQMGAGAYVRSSPLHPASTPTLPRPHRGGGMRQRLNCLRPSITIAMRLERWLALVDFVAT